MNNKWILTSEREPEKEGEYLVTTWYGEVRLMNYYNGWNKLNADDNKYEIESKHIKAWMPLPEPYKESEE